jgi:putative endonuclease
MGAATEARGAPASAKSWLVYIVTNAAGALYTGITTDLERRLREHREGRRGARFFRLGAARSLLYTERHDSRASASRREAEIKRMSRRAKLELIADGSPTS